MPERTFADEWRRSRTVQAGVLSLALLAGRLVNPDRPLPIDLCLFKRLTGVPCPTCGLTRAVCHALRGEWSASLSYHPAGILAAIFLVGWAVWSIAEALQGCEIRNRWRDRLGTTLLACGACLSLAGWIVGLVSGVWLQG